MSKKFKASASSSRVQAGGFGAGFGTSSSTGAGFGTGFGSAPPSQLSYVYEPPDLAAISDSAAVVSLKNLQKKDSTTKAKALDELLSQLAQVDEVKGQVEEGIVEAWVRLYARTSIDNARQVRQRAHTFQGQLTVLCGKRIAPFLPLLAGPWLCGLQDSDKQVARATQEAFEHAFATEQKRTGVWKVYHASIVEYCTTAVLNEDAKTLSDERSTNEDDAESKYSRTIASAILTITRALETLSEQEIEKEIAHYTSFFDSSKLWGLASSKDSFTRQAVYKALAARLNRLSGDLDEGTLKSVSSGLIGKGLRADQSGSSTAFVDGLDILTKAHPNVWTTLFSSKKRSSHQNLDFFLRQYPSSVTSDFWSHLASLFENIPIEVLNPETASAEGKGEGTATSWPLLEALHHGMTRRDDLRSNQVLAWKAYLVLARRIASQVNDHERLRQLAKENICPLAQQYVLPRNERGAWPVSGEGGLAVAIGALVQASRISDVASIDAFSSISSELIELMQTSLPEQSDGFQKSQLKVQGAFDKWAKIKSKLLEDSDKHKLSDAIEETSKKEVSAAIEILQARNFKPFGAVKVLRLGLSYVSIKGDDSLKELIASFLKTHGPALVERPSAQDSIAALQELDSIPPSLGVYDACLSGVLSQPDSQARNGALAHFLMAPWPKDAKLSISLAKQVRDSLPGLEQEDSTMMGHVACILANPTAPPDLIQDILTSLAEFLPAKASPWRTLQVLSSATEHHEPSFKEFLKTKSGAQLAPKLLLVAQDDEGVVTPNQVNSLVAKIKQLSTADGDSATYVEAFLTSIHGAFHENSLPVGSVVELAQEVITSASGDPAALRRLLPTENEWSKLFEPHLSTVPPTSLAITNALGGTLYLIEQEEQPIPRIKYDVQGLSPLVKTVDYVIELLGRMPSDFRLEQADLVELLVRLEMLNQLATDCFGTTNFAALWSPDETSLDHAVELVKDSRVRVRNEALVTPEMREAVLIAMLAGAEGKSVHAYYSARAHSILWRAPPAWPTDPLPQHDDSLILSINSLSGSMKEAAVCAQASIGPSFDKLVNNLVAEMARHDFEEHKTRGLCLLVLLNRLITSAGFREMTITQKHRIVLLVRRVTAAMNVPSADSTLTGEILQALAVLLPLVKDIFDTFWDEVIDSVVETLSSTSVTLPVVYASLTLYGQLLSLSKDDETNEDLVESWPEKEVMLHSALLKLLLNQAASSKEGNEPQRTVDDLISRYTSSIGDAGFETETLFPVLESKSSSLQVSAYRFLHRKIPRLQENIVMDAALVKDFKAAIPEGLLKVVSSAPKEAFELQAAPLIPSALSQFIFGWKLIFDHWVGASYQVQNDYVESIRATGSTEQLLDLIFDYLIADRLKPFDASKTKFEIFSVADSGDGSSIEQNLLKMLCHLYLLSLRHVPAIVRGWYRDKCPRSLQRPVAEWTEKFMSPLVVDAELGEVTSWIPKQETDTPLEVRVSTKAREVTAMYPVDEQMAAIRISLPADYPLSTIAVEDLNRVGVEERKWRAWLINAQGTMNFAPSSGGLGAVTDGLVAWRRNVTGTLKGQSECAICYSIVNADRQLPTKKCGTCKNAFHGTCLFRWFKSSGGSSCPLCRNAFNYG